MKILKKSELVLLFVFAILIFFDSCKNVRTQSFEAMDTVMRITVNADSRFISSKKADKAVSDSINKIQDLEKRISVTDSNSLVYQINHYDFSDNPENYFKMDGETCSLLKKSLEIAERTDGVFNPLLFPVTYAWGFTNGNYRIPSDEEICSLMNFTDYKKVKFLDDCVHLEQNMMLDFGAIAKGYTGDLIIELLKSQGVKSALLDFGGNVQAVGGKTDGSCWKVGVRCPWKDGVVAVLDVYDEAVITSGGYIRYFVGQDGKKYIHIFDGRTGKPAESDLLSATIVTGSGAYGDALSTTCFIYGKDEAVNFWRENKDFDMILITKDQSVYYTKNLYGKIQFLEDFKNIEVIE